MNVLFLIAEATPWVKVGGLGDVGGELPVALRRLGHDVRVVLPAYPGSSLPRGEAETRVELARGGETLAAAVHESGSPYGPIHAINGDPVRWASGVYGDPMVDAEKFLFWTTAALEWCRSTSWKPDVVHVHDWHAALALLRLNYLRPRDPFWADTAGVLTIHNLGYLGAGSEALWRVYGLEPLAPDDLPDWARALPLAQGIVAADYITTVSPTYANEIQTSEFGFGLDHVLSDRRQRLRGILNGLDLVSWNPWRDPSIATHYSAGRLESRAKNKAALQRELSLPEDPRTPLLGFIGRLETQKGIDIALSALGSRFSTAWQLVLLGSGRWELAREATGFAAAHAGRARFLERNDPALSRRIFAGADIVLVPSRYEPCGLVQMIAMRYGCVPIVHATGGLRDTVVDYASPDGTGFVFDRPEAEALAQSLDRAFQAYRDKRRWRALQRRGMALDHSWEASARVYVDVYKAARRERASIGQWP
ncbi:MAG TPA: glycogen/starch synthase [Anaerolineales bacterium]|nr:glycogen/starch synthase [Anaerolineales bacterium]